jgi:hypothetical protein
MLDAMGNVVAQHLLLQPTQGSADRGNLRYDVDTVAVLFDHPGEPTDLAFDPLEPIEARFIAIAASSRRVARRSS